MAANCRHTLNRFHYRRVFMLSMLSLRAVSGMALAATMLLSAGVACGQAASTDPAQAYPNRPVRIVATGVGGNGDIAARLIAQELTVTIGQPVIVENRGEGTLAIETVFKASPDGHTLLLNGSALWLTQFLRDRVAWDPVRDFLPITLTVSSPNVLVAHPAVPAKSVKELIALAQAKPGSLNYGTSGTGNSSHLAGELFKTMAGVDIVRVNYKGTSPALNDVMSGELQIMFTTTAVAPPLMKAGRLRALAVTSAQPTPLVPGLPTVAASGLPGYESASVLGLFAPNHTPASIINHLNREVVKVLNKADVKERFFNSGADVVASSPRELTAMIKSDMQRMGKVIKDAGIRD